MNLGMSGAAIATAGGTIVQFIVLLCYLLKKQNRLRLVKPRQLSKAIMKSLSAGFSASILEFSFIVLTCILNNQIMRYGGAVALSIFGVVLSCSGMFQHIYTGVGQAIQPIAANNYGAGQVLRIFRLRRIFSDDGDRYGHRLYHFGFAVSHADHKIFHGCHSRRY